MIGFTTPGRRALNAALSAALATFALSPLPADQGASLHPNRQAPGTRAPEHPTPALTGSDIVATVEGRLITRRDLTYLWLSTDRQASRSVGELLVARWRGAKGSLPFYSIPEAAIYARLYGKADKDPAYANILSNMVTTRLVEIEAGRKRITVTPQEARAAGHEMLDQVRKQQQLTLTDDQILTQFSVPRDIFMDDMAFRLRVERLLAADYARRNGRAITAEERANWKQIVEAQKAEYLTRLRHNARITSVVPLPEPTSATAQQEAAGAEMPPPPPIIKQ